MLRTDNLPDFVFVDEDGEETRLRLNHCGKQIRGMASSLLKHFPAGSVLGLIAPSGPELVLAWLSCVDAGMRPLILQYPNSKQSHVYWSDSIRNTIALVDLKAVIVDDHVATLDINDFVATIRLSELLRVAPSTDSCLQIDITEILQLSSGTTGYRKAIAFRGDDLVNHVNSYNQVLGLTREDRVVSWLPLYHDMGFIACFIMPLILGIEVVMMDPMTWVRDPSMLYSAIAQHRGTVCYMPNFGYEVMARRRTAAMPTMRWWISCSEPVSPKTCAKFLEAVDGDPSTFAPCYAMAENIFAVSIRRGVRCQDFDNVRKVSCGLLIPGTRAKVVEGELWIRSPVSLSAYVGGSDVRDSDGFYATGDLAEIIEDELYILGRKHDLVIQAGRKFLLSDIDRAVNELLPEVKGRAAAVAYSDTRIGTESARVLIEADDFFERGDQADISEQLKSLTGLDLIETAFVPPRFLTKTSSGKINRKRSAEDWLIAAKAQTCPYDQPAIIDEIKAGFGHIALDRPIGEALDSLSITILRILLTDAGIEYDGNLTLANIIASLETTRRRNQDVKVREGVRLVSFGERLLFDNLTDEHLVTLGDRLGVPVTFEHVCLPPSAIILSDLIFHDYFQPRLKQLAFSAVNRAFYKLRNASVLITDDAAEMFYPPEQTYGVLAHGMTRDPRTDLISVRWQNYSQSHHELPLTVVRGGDLPLENSSKALDLLSRYLSKPMFRIANYNGFGGFTRDWEWRPLRGHASALDPETFIQAVGTWIGLSGSLIKHMPINPEGLRLDLSDAIHFCSHAIKRAPIDLLTDYFDSFCIAGRTSSVPYVTDRLNKLGKPYIVVPSYAPEIMAAQAGQYDCLLICGAMGDFKIDMPAVALQHVGLPWRTRNLDSFGTVFAHLNTYGTMEDAPESGRDWYYRFDIVWGRNRDEWVKVRLASAEGKPA